MQCDAMPLSYIHGSFNGEKKKKNFFMSHSVFIPFDAGADLPAAAEIRAFSIFASRSARKDASTW